jgi:hypothetical protein
LECLAALKNSSEVGRIWTHPLRLVLKSLGRSSETLVATSPDYCRACSSTPRNYAAAGTPTNTQPCHSSCVAGNRKCCRASKSLPPTHDDQVRRLRHPRRRIPGARGPEKPGLAGCQGVLLVQDTAARRCRIWCAEKRGLELQAAVLALQCAGAAVVGCAVLGRERDFQQRHRELQLGPVGELGTCESSTLSCVLYADKLARKRAQTPTDSSSSPTRNS